MNRKQTVVLWVTIGLLVLVCLFPPTYNPGGKLLGLGERSRLDIVGFVQRAIPILAVGAGLFLTLRDKRKKDDKDK